MTENDKIVAASDALCRVRKEYVEEAVTYTAKKSKRGWRKWGAVAACLAVIAAGVALFGILRALAPEAPEKKIASFFTLTAYAENGEPTELDRTGRFNSSGTAQSHLFDVDMPFFQYTLRPTDLRENEALYARFSLSLSYNGITVGGKDEHVIVLYQVSAAGSGENWAYSVMGWFTEPTDLTMTVTDRESGAVVERTTVRITYVPDRQEYELKVVETETQYPALCK